MVELFDFAFPLHCFAPGIVEFYICEVPGSMGFGIFCAFPILVLLGSLVNVFSVAGVKASVHALHDVDEERHLRFIAP